MDPQTALDLVNASVLPAWALLIIAPHWRWTRRIVQTGLYPVGLGLLYAGLIVASLVTDAGGGEVDFTTLDGIAAIFSHPLGLLTAWVHFLVFDLFAGMWEARDAERTGVNTWWLRLCLALTFMAGPLGLLLYFAGRRRWSITDPAPERSPA